MRKMKDSGIEWIGEIPEEWKVVKMSKICNTITDYVASGSFASLAENVKYLDEPDYAMLVRTIDVSDKGYSSKPVYIDEHSYNFLSNSNLFGGEIILPNIGASVGDVYIIPILYKRMSLAPNSIMLRTNEIDKFVYYYFYSNAGRLSLLNIAQSTAQPKFNKTDFRQLKIPLPSKNEQQKISSYLDGKCREIDSVVSKTKATIEEYKKLKQSVITQAVTKGIIPNRPMKDSGIEWIGEIPQEWKIQPLKSLFSFGKGLPITKENLKEKGISVISYGQIHSKSNDGVHITPDLIRYVDEEYLNTNPLSLVNENDFIFADTSEDLDGCGNCVYDNVDIPLFAGYHTIILQSRINQNNQYFAYLFKSDVWRKQIREQVTGVKLFSISQKILKSVSVIVPPFAEQQEIANYLDEKCSEIDKLIAKKEQLLTEMENYKKAVIYEYVTGKKEV